MVVQLLSAPILSGLFATSRVCFNRRDGYSPESDGAWAGSIAAKRKVREYTIMARALASTSHRVASL